MKLDDFSYYKLNQVLLKFLGMWPYFSKRRKNISLIVFTLLNFSMIIPCILGAIRDWNTNFFGVLENSGASSYFTCCYFKIVSSYAFEDSIKSIYEQLIIDWKSLNRPEELEILHKYSKRGRLLCDMVVIYSAGACIMMIVGTALPLCLDILLPRADPWQQVDIYRPNYVIIDGDEYHLELFMTHGVMAICLSTIEIVAVDTTFFLAAMHICGMLAIVSHRLENLGKSSRYDSEYVSSEAKDEDIDEEIKEICNMHKHCLENIDRIQHSFSISFLLVVFSGVILSAILEFTIIENRGDNIPRFVVMLLILIGANICNLYTTWLTQNITDYCENILRSTYNSCWYNLPEHSKRLLIVIMSRSSKPCILTAGSICNLDLRMFSTMLKTSVSYFTVMLSLK